MVPFVALLALQAREVSVLDAMAAGTKVLAAFDVPGPFRQESAFEFDSDADPLWRITVEAADRRDYTVQVRAVDGWCENVWRVPLRSAAQRVPSQKASAVGAATLGDDQVALVSAGLTRLFDKGSFMSIRGGRSGDANVFSAEAAMGGYGFLPNRGPGWQISLDARTGALVDFTNAWLPKAFEFSKPRLSVDAAVASAARFLRVRPPKRSTQWYIERTTTPLPSRASTPPDVARQFGWFVVPASGHARLVWRIPFWWRWRTAQDTTTWTNPWEGEVFVDAATGEVVDSPVFDQDGKPRVSIAG